MPKLTDLASDERSARIVLSIIGKPSDKATGRLLADVGAVELIKLAENDSPIPRMDDVETAIWRDHMARSEGADSVAAQLAVAVEFTITVPGDRDWPTALDDLGERVPYVLWSRGNTSLLASPLSDRVTIAGARACTGYGDHVATELTDDVTREGRTIVAGGAYGIEGATHKAALSAGGNTIAVMAAGVDRPYPYGHAEMLERVADRGLLMSEVPPGRVPTRQRFLDRARLLAALSGTSVIVEAGARSGALRVVDEAERLGRPVGAVPGPITSAASYGTNNLIRDHRAHLVTSGRDVLGLDQRTVAPMPGREVGLGAYGRVTSREAPARTL